MNQTVKWTKLKSDVERAVEEGFERGFNNSPETPDGAKFVAFRYVLDLMNRLDGEENASITFKN